MAERESKTTHGLADLLFELARWLKSLPNQALRVGGVSETDSSKTKRTGGSGAVAHKVEETVRRIKSLPRDQAEDEIKGMTVRQIRELSKAVGLPVGSKQPKQQLVRRVVFHLFDYHTGHEVIRYFGRVDDFRESREFYRANLQRLVEQYEGKFIAIIGGEVVDSDHDFSPLADRVYKRFGYKEIFMPRVERVQSAVDVPSPMTHGPTHR